MSRPSGFVGRRVLVVEDEYLIAADIADALEALGIAVTGLVSSAKAALTLLEADDPSVDGVLLNINLRNVRAYPVADALAARGIPFAFMTGYDSTAIPTAYAGIPRLEKPVDAAQLARVLKVLWPDLRNVLPF